MYEIGPQTVVDGDTLRVGQDQRVRVAALDCEEVYKNAEQQRAAEADFAAYASAQRAGSPRPVKYGTAAGLAAREFVRELLKTATHLRLERDEVQGRTLDTYGRLLAHVILLTEQGEVNLAERVIRAGHSPYFTKYGRSLRFDALFEQAQAAAQEAGCGIWASEGAAHYPDYPERLKWWNARAEQVRRWRAQPADPARISLDDPQAAERIQARLGQSTQVFGLLARHLEASAGKPTILLFGDARRPQIAAVIFSGEVLAALDLAAISSMYVTLRGTLTEYQGRAQFVIEDPKQIEIR